nr:hypothetical protein [Sunxiuqinia sp.]
MSRIQFPFLIMISALLAVACITGNRQAEERLDVDQALQYCVEKTKVTMAGLTDTDSLPRNILQGQSEWNKVGVHAWCSGFWPGILWYAYEASGDSAILANASEFTDPLRGVLNVPVDNHDLGFMLYCSFGN